MDPERDQNKSDSKPKTDTRPTIVDPSSGSPGTPPGRRFSVEKFFSKKNEIALGQTKRKKDKNQQKS